MKRIIPILIVALMLAVLYVSASAAGSAILVNASVDNNTKVAVISGTVSSASPSDVTVVVKNPAGELDYIDQMKCGADGKYSFIYKLDEAVSGNYIVSVGWNGEKGTGSFTYTAPSTPPVVTPTPTPTPAPEPSEFTDIKGNWAQKEMMELAKAGILNGYSDGTVKPNANATRAEFVHMVIKLMKVEAKTSASFTDISNSAWYMKALSAAVEKGWITGRTDGSFGPNDSITREEAIIIISRVLESLGVKATGDSIVLDAFKDSADISDWAKADVAKLVGLGIIKGSNGMINPKTEISRAEISAILCRVMESYIK